MSIYIVLICDMQFIFNEVVGFEEVCVLLGNEECFVDFVEFIFEEVVKFVIGVFDLINCVGDIIGLVCKDGVVIIVFGFKEVYKLFVEIGWNVMLFLLEFGGQGLLVVVLMVVNEMWKLVNMVFGLCLMLIGGVIEVIVYYVFEELK